MVSFGASYPGQKLHAPNENIRLDDYFKAMNMMGRFIRDFAANAGTKNMVVETIAFIEPKEQLRR